MQLLNSENSRKFTKLKEIDFEKMIGSSNGDIILNTGSNKNSCYMNSVIQCLSNTFAFYQYFVNFKLFLNDLPFEDNEQPSITVEFVSLINNLWNKKSERFVNKDLFALIVSDNNEKFKPGVSNDAQEFLLFLLNELSSDLNRIKEESIHAEIQEKI